LRGKGLDACLEADCGRATEDWIAVHLSEKLAAAEAIIGMIATADAGTWSSALCKDYLAPPAPAGEVKP